MMWLVAALPQPTYPISGVVVQYPIRSRMILLFSLASLSVACGTQKTTPPDNQPNPSDGGTPDGGDVPDAGGTKECASPFAVDVDPAAQAKATAALQTLAPTATLNWSDVRGTLTSIDGLTVQLPDCTGSVDVFDQFFDVLEKTPDLFQIDRTEWRTSGPMDCSTIGDFQTVIIRRAKYGSYSMINDVFSAVAQLKDGVVILRNFSGTYIPGPSEKALATLDNCPQLADSEVLPLLREKPFLYATFADSSTGTPPCTIDGEPMYTAQSTDTLTLSDELNPLAWTEDTGKLEFHQERTATLVVAAENYTPDLLRSSANCTDFDGNPQIGWVRTFDAVTGAVLYDHASPDPYCEVCFSSSTTR